MYHPLSQSNVHSRRNGCGISVADVVQQNISRSASAWNVFPRLGKHRIINGLGQIQGLYSLKRHRLISIGILQEAIIKIMAKPWCHTQDGITLHLGSSPDEHSPGFEAADALCVVTERSSTIFCSNQHIKANEKCTTCCKGQIQNIFNEHQSILIHVYCSLFLIWQQVRTFVS